MKQHTHIYEYTIDPDIGLNPCIASKFGSHIFSNIPIFEGFMLKDPNTPENKTKYFLSEILRLLECNGIVCSNNNAKDIIPLYKKINKTN